MIAVARVSVGQLVAQRPERARVFEKFDIDYCCGGRKPLEEACQEKNLDLQAVLRELEDLEQDSSNREERNWSDATMTELADHIEQKHHGYLKSELPRLEMLTKKVATVHGPEHPELVELRKVFDHFKAELENHMAKEETILFPICRKLEQSNQPFASHCGSVQNPIRVMLAEHDDAGYALERFRVLTNDYSTPADACNTYRAFMDSLRQLERDMHQHVHKENNILFPKAIAAEKQR